MTMNAVANGDARTFAVRQAYSSHAARTCPKCGESLYRIHRRIVDRVASLVVPLQRFRCANVECLWEGNLRRRSPAFVPPVARYSQAVPIEVAPRRNAPDGEESNRRASLSVRHADQSRIAHADR